MVNLSPGVSQIGVVAARGERFYRVALELELDTDSEHIKVRPI